MSVISVYPDVAQALCSVPARFPSAWAAFVQTAYKTHQPFFDGLVQTYGETIFGSGGLPGAIEQMAPMLRQALMPAPTYGLEEHAGQILSAISVLLPGEPPDLYLGVLFFLAPAATLSVNGRPAIALGMERFHPAPPDTGEKFWYHPREVEEMVPHEAAHAARMRVLGLSPTPQRLNLLDMVMLEGTALAFTDRWLGRTTLATFMPRERMLWHQQNDRIACATVLADAAARGMGPFLHYFSAHSPVSGYWVGHSLCRQYLERFGAESLPELVTLPSTEILSRLGIST